MIGLVCSSTCCPMAWFIYGHITFTAVFSHNTCTTSVAHELVTIAEVVSTVLSGQPDVKATQSDKVCTAENRALDRGTHANGLRHDPLPGHNRGAWPMMVHTQGRTVVCQ